MEFVENNTPRSNLTPNALYARGLRPIYNDTFARISFGVRVQLA